MKTELKSIEEEKQTCIEAFKASPTAKFAWCCHHGSLIEALTEPWLNRVNYICSSKPKAEQASRLRSFRPVRITLPDQIVKARNEYYKILDEYCKLWIEHKKVVTEHEKVKAEYCKLWTEYEKAKAKHEKVVTEHEKVATEYHSGLILLHNQDWPTHTWNGKRVEGT